MEKLAIPCREEGAEVFAAGSAVVLVRKVDSARGRAKYEVKVKRADDCSVVDIIPETASLTSKEVARLLKRAGLTPEELERYIEWVRKLVAGPSRDEVAALFRDVMKAAKEALSGRLDSPHLDLLIPKRDKETLTNCRPSECWKSANAAAVVPTKIDERFGVLDFDSEDALEEAESLGFDPQRHMHILAGPAADAVLTPEGKWRTPNGQVLDSIPRKLHVPVYIPEGCKHDLKASGFELKCREAINIVGRHPSGAEYEFVDGELLEVSFERLREFAEDLSGRGEITSPNCSTPRRVDLDKLTELFQRIYSAAQAAGYSRHDALYDLGILCRLACVPKEDAGEAARRVYGTAGAESQTLSQRLSHIERAYRASRDGGPKLRPPHRIYERWRQIDEATAEEIFRLLDIDTDREIARECIGESEVSGRNVCTKYIVAEVKRRQFRVVIESIHLVRRRNGETKEDVVINRTIVYRGPRPRKVFDVARGTWFFEIGGFYGTSLEQVIEKLRRPSAGVDLYINTRYIDNIIAILNKAAKEEKVALTVGLLPTEKGAVLVDDYGILDVGPSLEEAVADLEKALRSVETAYPEANRDAALATVGYVLGLNAAPVWWLHKPNSEVPLPIIYGASGLGKSELMRRVVEPAVVGVDAKRRIWELRRRIADETLYDYLTLEVLKDTVYSTPEQLRNDLDANTLVLILDEQKPGDPRNSRAPAKIFGRFWLQVATAEWGRRLAQHAAKYGGGFGYKFFRLRAFAIVTNYSPDEWKKAGLAEAVSAEGAIDRRIFEIPWEDAKLDGSRLGLIYTPRYSVLKVLEVAINKHFGELMAQSRFADFVIALWRKIVEDFEPKLGRLEGIRRMIEALERLAQYNLEKNKLRDPDAVAKETLRRNALTYLREEVKIIDLSPAKLVAKVVEYAQELGVVFRKPKWSDEIDKVREDFCRALAKAVDVPDYDCGEFVSTEIESYGDPASAPLFNQIVDRELREALWKIFVNYAAKGYTPSVAAKSVLWPYNTRYMGKVPRTCGGSNCYYKLTWGDFFDVFVGKLVESEYTEESYVSNVHNVSNPPTPLTSLEEQATNIKTTTPADVDTSQEQSGLDTTSRTAESIVPNTPAGQTAVPKGRGGLDTAGVSSVLNVPNPPTPLTNLEKQKTNIEVAPLASVNKGKGQSGLDTLCTLDTDLPANNIETKINVQSAAPDSAETCLANPICANRLILCLWKRLKVPKEEKKAAITAEIERRGDLFAYCFKNALEYARRESEP
jgi:hypothetical protein